DLTMLQWLLGSAVLADQMVMWLRAGDFVYRLAADVGRHDQPLFAQEFERTINRRPADRRVTGLDTATTLLRARMTVAFAHGIQNKPPLRGLPKTAVVHQSCVVHVKV